MADTKLYELLGVSRNASDSEIRKVMYQLLNLCYNYHFFLSILFHFAFFFCLIYSVYPDSIVKCRLSRFVSVSQHEVSSFYDK